jgi:hypothetical protein
MSVFKRLQKHTTAEVDAMGFRWKLRAIKSSDLARLGVAQLLLIPAGRDALEAIANLSTEASTDTEPQTQAERLDALQAQHDMIRAIGTKTLPEQKRISEEVVAAAVCALWDDETQTWEPCSVVLDQAREDQEGAIIWVGRLTEGIDTLAGAAFQLAAGGREAVEALAAFPGGA